MTVIVHSMQSTDCQLISFGH